jgi:hypothetical protein
MAQWAFRWRQSHSSKLCKFGVVSEWPTNRKYTSQPPVMTGDGKLKVGVMLLNHLVTTRSGSVTAEVAGSSPVVPPSSQADSDLWRL